MKAFWQVIFVKRCLIYTKNMTLVLEHSMIKYADQHVILSMHVSVFISLGTIICSTLKRMLRVWSGNQICYILKKFKHLERFPCYLGMTSKASTLNDSTSNHWSDTAILIH